MPAPSQAEAKTRFIDLLNETVYQALGLKESLEDEFKALESQDPACVEVAVVTKSACVSKLQHLDQERMQLCATCGFAAGPEQMEQLIAWCDDSELIKNRWEHLMVIAAESRAQNITNGAIIRVRQQQFEASLSVLRGVSPGADTYGRHGEESDGFGHRSLAQA